MKQRSLQIFCHVVLDFTSKKILTSEMIKCMFLLSTNKFSKKSLNIPMWWPKGINWRTYHAMTNRKTIILITLCRKLNKSSSRTPQQSCVSSGAPEGYLFLAQLVVPVLLLVIRYYEIVALSWFLFCIFQNLQNYIST